MVVRKITMFNCLVGWVWLWYVPLETQTVVILASVRHSLEAHIFLGCHVKSDSLNIIHDSLMQGSMFNTWKPMWVVLLEDGIEFYKRKADNSPKGMIPLKGSCIHSPCQDFGKRMVSTFKNKNNLNYTSGSTEKAKVWWLQIPCTHPSGDSLALEGHKQA